MSARSPDHIDQHAGAQLRIRRSEFDMSQSELGEKLGVTFQQVQKYERGTNRISAGRLFKIAHILNVPITYFYDGLDQSGSPKIGGGATALYDFIVSPDGLDLAEAFTGIRHQTTRRRVIDLIRSISGEQEAT